MPAAVKICGLSDPETLETAIEAGAAFAGFVFFPRSPRNVSLDDAEKLANQARGRTKIVALTVDADEDLVDAINHRIAPDYFQAHGSETPERVQQITERTGKGVIKAIKVRDASDVANAACYGSDAAWMLYDAKAPETHKNALPGGNGLTFDWTLLDSIKSGRDYMLSGGLDPETVGDALQTTGAAMVDVSSGVESAPGIKDKRLIRKFIEAAHAAS